MRTIIWFIYFWLYQVALLPKYFILGSKLKKGYNIQPEIHKITVNWSRRLIKLAGSKIEVIGSDNVPKEGPVVFVANHQGNFDIPLLLGYIDKPKGFIAKAETEKMPIVGGWMKYMNCVFMDRDNPRAALKSIKEAIEIVKTGHALVIFPEGTRSLDGKMADFKAGSFKLATKANATIIPVTISGTIDIMEKGSKWIKPAHVRLIISKGVTPDEYNALESHEVSDKIHKIIESHL